MYRVQIIARHAFGAVLHESYHLSLAGAELACEQAMARVKANDAPEWHRYLEATVTPMTLEA